MAPLGKGPRVTFTPMSSDGSNVLSVAPEVGGAIFSPLLWSPNGQRLAFVLRAHSPIHVSAVWVMFSAKSDGSGWVSLGETIGLPAWSPDSSRLAFVRRGEGRTALYTIGADGKGLKVIHEIDAKYLNKWANVTNNLAWSPSGEKILLSGKGMAAIVDLKNEEFQLVTNLRPRSGSPLLYSSWSPDGSQIAVNISGGDVLNGFDPLLYVMDADGSNKRILARYVLEIDFDRYGNDPTYLNDNRVVPAHGEPWPADYEVAPKTPIPESSAIPNPSNPPAPAETPAPPQAVTPSPTPVASSYSEIMPERARGHRSEPAS